MGLPTTCHGVTELCIERPASLACPLNLVQVHDVRPRAKRPYPYRNTPYHAEMDIMQSNHTQSRENRDSREDNCMRTQTPSRTQHGCLGSRAITLYDPKPGSSVPRCLLPIAARRIIPMQFFPCRENSSLLHSSGCVGSDVGLDFSFSSLVEVVCRSLLQCTRHRLRYDPALNVQDRHFIPRWHRTLLGIRSE